MNWSNGDSKTALSQKPGQNCVRCPSTQTGPARHPGTPRCAQTWSYRGRTRPCRGRGPGRVAGSAAVSQRPCLTPRALPPAPQRPAPQCQRLLAPRACCAPSAVSWAQCRSRQRRVVAVCAHRHGRIVACLATQCPASSSLSCRNTLYCIAMQFQPNQTAAIQYIVLQYSLLSAHLRPPCHDTLSVL